MVGTDAPAQEISKRGAAGSKTRARAVLDRPPELQGWSTTDEEEVELRRWRGRTEIGAVEPLEPGQPVYGTFRVHSETGGTYEVEIRSLEHRTNTCGCIDHRVNGLGTCKHIEGVLEVFAGKLRRPMARSRAAARVEIFLDRRDGVPPGCWPDGQHGGRAVREWLEILKSDGTLESEPAKIAELLKAWPAAPAHVHRRLAFPDISDRGWSDSSVSEAGQEPRGVPARCRARPGEFDCAAPPASLPARRHAALAFGERALLADEMGLGKTVQAIAAASCWRDAGRCARSDRLSGVAQGGVGGADCPLHGASGTVRVRPAAAAPRRLSRTMLLQHRQLRAGVGRRRGHQRRSCARHRHPRRGAAHQELADQDRAAGQGAAVAYAFVLTGTPIENRIDELYSIVQYLDPELFGPLFRFNRDFYALDERGRPVDYQNLAEFRSRVAPVMLRRRKADVESELPGRRSATTS